MASARQSSPRPRRSPFFPDFFEELQKNVGKVSLGSTFWLTFSVSKGRHPNHFGRATGHPSGPTGVPPPCLGGAWQVLTGMPGWGARLWPVLRRIWAQKRVQIGGGQGHQALSGPPLVHSPQCTFQLTLHHIASHPKPQVHSPIFTYPLT